MILGKMPPPYIGPAVATKILLDSKLNERFDLTHFDTKLNERVEDMGTLKWSKLGAIRNMYRRFRLDLDMYRPDLALIPIGQTTAGFFKDIPLIRAAAKSGTKVLLHLRGSAFRDWYDGLDPARRIVVKHALAAADGVIVLGDNLRELFHGLFVETVIYAVPNGGNYVFPERKSAALRITYLANYLPGKGLAELLAALYILDGRRGIPSFEFVGYGQWDDEDYRKKCMEMASGLSFSCRLNSAVSGDEKWQALADTDVFVFAPVAPEGHPWSIVEALAARLPILATDRGAIRQSVIDGQNGFLLDEPDPQALADRLEMLLRDEELRSRMAVRSGELYRSGFTEDAMIEKLAEVISKTLEGSCAG